MTDPILYLSMLLGLGGVYVLISSFHDDDDGDDDGEKYIYNLEDTNLVRSRWVYKEIVFLLNLLANKGIIVKISGILKVLSY